MPRGKTFKDVYNRLIQESGANQQRVAEWAGIKYASSLNRLISSDIALSKMCSLLAVLGYTVMITNGQSMYAIEPNERVSRSGKGEGNILADVARERAAEARARKNARENKGESKSE